MGEPFDCLIVCSLRVSKFSHFSLFHPSIFIQYSTEECSTVQLLASSLEYPQRIEWSQCLNSVSVCLFCACKQIFSFFPLSSFSFYTVQYRRVQYSTVIGQLPRVSTEDRVVSVFEFRVCLSVCSLCVSPM